MIMKNITRIVVGIDFSIFSQRIMEYAAGIAERNLAEIVAVSVINKRQIDYIRSVCENQAPTTITVNKYIDDETSRRTHRLHDLIAQCVPDTLRTKIIIRIGVPYEEILKVVDDVQADLVVISSKGRTNFQDYMFGTTSEKIFRHCPVSVLSLNFKE